METKISLWNKHNLWQTTLKSNSLEHSDKISGKEGKAGLSKYFKYTVRDLVICTILGVISLFVAYPVGLMHQVLNVGGPFGYALISILDPLAFLPTLIAPGLTRKFGSAFISKQITQILRLMTGEPMGIAVIAVGFSALGSDLILLAFAYRESKVGWSLSGGFNELIMTSIASTIYSSWFMWQFFILPGVVSGLIFGLVALGILKALEKTGVIKPVVIEKASETKG